MILKQKALKLVRCTSKYSHSLIVSTIMKKLATTLGKSEKQWALVGFREVEGPASDLFLHVMSITLQKNQ